MNGVYEIARNEIARIYILSMRAETVNFSVNKKERMSCTERPYIILRL